MSEIPSPVDTGASGTQQEPAKEMATIVAHSPLEGLPIARAVEGLAATKARSMGGEVAAGLLAGCFQQISNELEQARADLRSTRGNLELVREDLSTSKQRSAVLQERVRAMASGRHLKNLSLTAGTALVGIAIEFMRNNMKDLSFVLGGLGFLLILFGWLAIGGEE